MKTLFISLLTLVALSASAQNYSYTGEGFESSAFDTKNSTVTTETGKWTTNKNVRTSETAASGSSSLLFSNKAGLTLPPLTHGAGTLIYYAKDQNRQALVEVTRDNSTWTQVESYKVTSDWTRHVVSINDPEVVGVRISTTSNNQFWIDDLLLTKPDGTDGYGNILVTDLVLPYFCNDFEHTKFPQTKEGASTERSFNVDGEGEWKYLNAYKSTNSTYITDGSSQALRLLKSGSHVITPVLSNGVTKIMFDEGRTGRYLNIYTSIDEGATWSLLSEVTTDTHNTISVLDASVNRIKIANESTKGDADLDNLTVCGFPYGVAPTVVTGALGSVTATSAHLTGTITAQGDHPVIDRGVLWAEGKTPGYGDNVVKSADATDNFSVEMTGLPALAEIHALAYAVSFGGLARGEEVIFTTATPSLPTVRTVSLTPDDFSDEKHVFIVARGKVIDTGGSDVTETGFVYSTSVTPTESSPRFKAALYGDEFSTSLPLDPSTTYYIRAYAVNKGGTALGEELTVTTGKIDVPSYPHNVYFCDPQGDDATADGSEEHPFYSLQRAVDIVAAGDTIYMNAGTYAYSSRINIPTVGAPNSGMIALHSRGGRAVLDFSTQGLGDNNQGIRHTGSYWHYLGLDIINAGDNGLLIERNKPSGGSYPDIAARKDEAHDNVIEQCNFIRNQDTGLQMKNLAEYNRVINCDSYYNTDPGHGNADGFAVKISQGTGNYFYGCRAWRNSDDGWDQFIKKEGGFPDDVTTTLEYCWAFENGILENGSIGKGNGNGFKMGSKEGRNNIIMNRCLAFDNVNKGFDQNHNTGNMILNNCAGYSSHDASNKSRYTYRLDEAVAEGHEIRLTNCVALSDGIYDRSKSSYTPWSVNGTFVTSDMNTLETDYTTLSTEGTFAGRKADGTLPDIDFLRPASGSLKFVDKGTTVAPYEGQNRWAEGIIYEGSAPDLGYFETSADSGIFPVLSASVSDISLKAFVTASGEVVVTLTGADATEDHDVIMSDLNGRIIASCQFNGHTVTLRPSAAEGQIVVIAVDSSKSVKIRMCRQ